MPYLVSLVQQLVHWLFGIQKLLDTLNTNWVNHPWCCHGIAALWACHRPIGIGLTGAVNQLAGNHYVKHTMPNAKPNPYAMPRMASNTNECIAKNGWLQHLFSSQQASTASQWSMSLWLASCCMASCLAKSPCCSGAEQKMVPAALWPMGSQHHSWLASGLASSIEWWCHSMALPQLLGLPQDGPLFFFCWACHWLGHLGHLVLGQTWCPASTMLHSSW